MSDFLYKKCVILLLVKSVKRGDILMANIERIWMENYKDFIDLKDFCSLVSGTNENAEEEIVHRMDSLLAGHVLTLKSA